MNNFSCENLQCYELKDGNCLAAEYVTGQANTVDNPQFARQFTKAQLGKAILNYTTRRLNVLCREEDEALRSAIEYATNIWQQMPEDVS